MQTNEQLASYHVEWIDEWLSRNECDISCVHHGGDRDCREAFYQRFQRYLANAKTMKIHE